MIVIVVQVEQISILLHIQEQLYMKQTIFIDLQFLNQSRYTSNVLTNQSIIRAIDIRLLFARRLSDTNYPTSVTCHTTGNQLDKQESQVDK